jgi:hypothetical protein
MSIDKKISYKDQRLTKAQQKKAKPANQGGGPNYLGKQETATVPKKWLSSPDHVVAELAYITPREQKILLDADLYGSLKGKPNKGPGGIMSLQGDLGGYDASPGGPDSESGDGGSGNNDKARAADIMTGNVTTGQTTETGPRTKQYSDLPEFIEGPDGKMQHVASAYKSYGQPSFFGNLLSRGEPGYRGIQGLSAFGKPTFKNDGRDYITENKNFGKVNPGIGGRLIGGLAGLATGIPFIGPVLGNMYDYGKGIFGPKQKDMSQFNNLGLYTDRVKGYTRPEGYEYLNDEEQQAIDLELYNKGMYTDDFKDMYGLSGSSDDGGTTILPTVTGTGGDPSNPQNQTTTTDDVDDSVEDLLLRFYGKDRTKDFASLGYKNPAELRKAALERAKNLYT